MAENNEKSIIERFNNVNDTSAAIKATKRSNIDIGMPEGEQPHATKQEGKEAQAGRTSQYTGSAQTPPEISNKLNRIYDILGSRSLGAIDTRKRIEYINATDINMYVELMQLANYIAEYYSAHPITKGSIDFGTANNAKTLAERILTADKSISVPGFNFGFGSSKLETSAINNYKTAVNNILAKATTYNPRQMVEALKAIQDYNTYELQVYRAIPKGNEQALLTSQARLDEYERMWGALIKHAETAFTKDQLTALTFLEELLNVQPTKIILPEGKTIDDAKALIAGAKYQAELQYGKKTSTDISTGGN